MAASIVQLIDVPAVAATSVLSADVALFNAATKPPTGVLGTAV
jgi:hypothetical protein